MRDALIRREHRTTTFDPTIPPVEEVGPGATVCFETDDSAYVRLAAGESLDDIGIENLNAVTGPVAIREAEVGDLLRIDVLTIEINRAWAAWLPGFGTLGYRTSTVQVKQLGIQGSWLCLDESIRVPLEPMIGCIGLAPASGQASTLKPTYPFGGNMDLRELSPGATLWLPVQVPGACSRLAICTLRWATANRRTSASRLRDRQPYGSISKKGVRCRTRGYGWAAIQSAWAWTIEPARREERRWRTSGRSIRCSSI